MKHIFSIILFISSLVLVAGCEDYLEKPDSSGMTEDVVFSTMNGADKVLAAAYAFAPWGFPSYMGADGSWNYAFRLMNHNTTNMCDEAHTQSNAWDVQALNYYIKGTLSSNLQYPYLEDKWMFNYQAIRSAYLYLDKVDRVKDGDPAVIKIRKAEARAFIATKFYENFKRYGGLPWVPKYTELGETYSTKRLSIEASVDSICSLLDMAIPDLPAVTDGQEFGRINKISAMAMKARTLLWGASPLFNPEDNNSYFPSYSNQDLIKYDTYDKERWRLAAEAAEETLNEALANGYKLTMVGDNGITTYKEAYKACVYYFPNDPIRNTEIIWGTRLTKTFNENEWGRYYRIPWGRMGTGFVPMVYCTVIPLQNFVEFYEMNDGSDQPSDLYSKTNPYDNLDARFSASMFYHNYQLDGNAKPVVDMSFRSATDKGANRPEAVDNYTGYYYSKFIKDQEVTGELSFHNGFWPYIRLAEIYLMVAEAWNEYDNGGHNAQILDMINVVRNRAGQPDLQTIPGFQNNQAYLRERIKRERAVELAFEEHRYFDLKRWKMGNEYIGCQTYMMDVTGSAASPTYEKKPFGDQRFFSDKFYLYPIPLEEVQKSDVIQNPGW
jgi:hypothetical protein